MATSRKRKCNVKDLSHTFLISLDSTHPPSVGPLAVVDKVSSDYCHTLSHTHAIWLPTPFPPQFFFDNFKLNDKFKLDKGESNYDTLECTQPVILEVTKDSVAECKKLFPSSVS